jgi:phage terminase large subunit-like protein
LFQADRIFGEKNFGGDMVEATLRTVDPSIPYQNVSASRSKARSRRAYCSLV